MPTPKNIICITEDKRRRKSKIVKKLLSTFLSYWDPVEKHEVWADEVCYNFIIESVKISIIDMSRPYHLHLGVLRDANEWGADVIICSSYHHHHRCSYNTDDFNELLADFADSHKYNINWLTEPVEDSFEYEDNAGDDKEESLTDSFVRFIIDIIEEKYNISISGKCVIDSILVEEGSDLYDKIHKEGNALEFLTYKKFGNTNLVYRLDKGDGSPGRQDHIHVFYKNNQIFAINRDGSPHDGSKYKLNKRQMRALKELGFKYPEDGILECICMVG